jgi:hypothetical protein
LRKVGPDSARIYAALEARFGKDRMDDLIALLEDLSRLKA